MRRRAILVSVMAGTLLVATVAGVAWAKTFTCKPNSTKQNPCEGTDRPDIIFGTESDDFIIGKDRKDQLIARAGNDTAKGGDGPDRLTGFEGNDFLSGGKDDDDLGDATGPAVGDPADIDRLDGGRGADAINVMDGDSLDAVCSGRGADTVSSDPGDRVDDPLVC
jgi:Ca2+-binding RTX toxin-like protein